MWSKGNWMQMDELKNLVWEGRKCCCDQMLGITSTVPAHGIKFWHIRYGSSWQFWTVCTTITVRVFLKKLVYHCVDISYQVTAFLSNFLLVMKDIRRFLDDLLICMPAIIINKTCLHFFILSLFHGVQSSDLFNFILTVSSWDRLGWEWLVWGQPTELNEWMRIWTLLSPVLI